MVSKPARLLLGALALSVLLAPVGLAQANGKPCQPTVMGELHVERLQSTTFGDTQTLRIWLPPGYHDGPNAHRAYPLLILLDGQNLFDRCTSSFNNEWQIDEVVTRLIGEHKVQPILIIGIDAPAGNARTDEYIPFPDALFGGPAEPRGRLFPRFLTDEVLPRIASEYRIQTGAGSTAIGGSSYGAVAALYTLVTRPDIFGLGLLESTSLQVGNGELLRMTSSLGAGPRRVYIGVGADEMGGHDDALAPRALTTGGFNAGFVRMSEQLARNFKASMFDRPDVLFVTTPGARHTETAWAARFPAAIQFLFPASTPAPTQPASPARPH